MSALPLLKSFSAPPICEKEVLRYAGCREADENILALLRSCTEEAAECFTYNVCYRVCDLSVSGAVCDFGAFSVESETLSQNLSASSRAIIFAATVGTGIDRLISKYSRISPARAVILQALGAERIEALCDAFCREMENELGGRHTPRRSPGYGDISLSVQHDIFSVLDAPRKIGLSLNDSLLMSPTKSVTAFIGVS
ncbi:MAG: Vitamin B12 dependent methionine synthase activation subunit [Oscillospiraceae bacterium]|nr:Vitamin B12 dependent methionine synthase activation subunit [Oscillospiraceae bacterium]